jgi:hypothetical protein
MTVPTISDWLPCSVYYNDLFIPTAAAPLLRALIGLDDESAAMSMKLWCCGRWMRNIRYEKSQIE